MVAGKGKWSVLMITLALAAAPASATIVIDFAYPSGNTVLEGATLDVQIVASIPEVDAIVGWGMDMIVDDGVIAIIDGAPTIGGLFAAAASPDGDGLAGLALPADPAVFGASVLLATVTIRGNVQGITGLTLSDDNAYNGQGPDLTEGFLLDPPPPGGYAEVVYNTGSITVIPEPVAFVLLLCGGAVALRRRRA